MGTQELRELALLVDDRDPYMLHGTNAKLGVQGCLCLPSGVVRRNREDAGDHGAVWMGASWSRTSGGRHGSKALLREPTGRGRMRRKCLLCSNRMRHRVDDTAEKFVELWGCGGTRV